MTNNFHNSQLNIAASNFSWIEQYNISRDHANKIAAAAEKTKAFTLRGGSAGCVTKEGNFIGTNPYDVLARFMGYQTPFLRSTFDIFDGGFGNEANWDKRLAEHPASEFKFTGDTNYPLVIKDFVRGYPLTGRPDGVVLTTDGQDKALCGVEHKGIFGSSSAEKCLNGKPKTENLCQAVVYMTGFGIPWSLCYSNSSNFKTYKTPAGPGKAEYHLGLIDGQLYFNWKGVITETIIDVEGVREFYESIVEAYETKDYSWFKRESQDYLGEPEAYDVDQYNTNNLMFDRTGGFAAWEDQMKRADGNPHILQYKSVKRQDVFQLWNTDGAGKLVKEYYEIEEARKALRKTW